MLTVFASKEPDQIRDMEALLRDAGIRFRKEDVTAVMVVDDKDFGKGASLAKGYRFQRRKVDGDGS